jgi:peptide/nickel transport system permease protein
LTDTAAPPPGLARLDSRRLLVAAAVVLAIAAVCIALLDNPTNLRARELLPLSGGYLLGSDQVGRSLLRQLCRATVVTVAIGGAASLLSVAIGFGLGLGSIAAHPAIRAFFTILVDLKSGLPTFFVALLLGAIFGQTPLFLFIVLCFVGVEFSARATKDGAAAFMDGPMYRSLIAEGVARRRRFAHVFLYMSPLLLPLWALVFLEAILVESGLSFVGLGLRPDLASLGVLIREYYRVMLQYSLPIVLATGTLGTLCVLLFHFARRRGD